MNKTGVMAHASSRQDSLPAGWKHALRVSRGERLFAPTMV